MLLQIQIAALESYSTERNNFTKMGKHVVQQSQTAGSPPWPQNSS